jgi:uncharacterized protein YcfL
MVRLSLVLVVLLLAGCASSPGHPVMAWQHLEHEASSGPGDAWIDAHPTDNHMRCFPFNCH